MKRLTLLALLFALLGAVLSAQFRADSTVFVSIDTLIERGDFSGIPDLIRKDAAGQAVYWAYFCDRVKMRAEEYYDQDSFPVTLAILEHALQTLARAGRSDSLPAARLWVWKAFAHQALEQYTGVLDAYSKALRIYELNRYNAPLVAYAYKNAAQVCIRRQNYAQANQYLLAALESDSSGSERLSIYGQLANNAYWQDNLDLALRYYHTGERLTGDPDYRASLESVGGLIFLKKGLLAKAETLTRSALSYYAAEPKERRNHMRCLTTLAEIAAHTDRPALADRYYREAEEIGNTLRGKSRERAKLYTEWGDFLAKQGNVRRAMACYQNAMIQAYPDFDNPDPAANPSLEEAPLELWAMQAPARKAALLLQNPGPEGRLAAAHCFDLAFATADRLRRTFGGDEAKLFQAQYHYNLRRESALNLWELYRQMGDPKILERLFLLLENNRARVLRDALQQQRALALSSVPDSLLQLEEQQRIELAELQTNIREIQGKGDSSRAALLIREQTRIQVLYEALMQHLREKYSSFRDFLDAGQTAAPADIRNTLADSAVLVSWFDTGDRYIGLAVRRQTISGFEVLRDTTLDQALSRFQKTLADKSAQERNPAAFFADAWFLSQRLLPDGLLDGANQLVIAPDNELAYLPFEALLLRPYNGAYANAPYLLRNYRIHYVWSASLLVERPVSGPKGYRMLQLAPFAKKSPRNLAVLPNSLLEKPEHCTVDIREGAAATADAFLEAAPKYSVLHLSTHAHAGRNDKPGIELFDRAVGLPELYAQRLRAALVVLSACETGAGAYAGGEGVLSLARAFAYAGAGSLLASHWSVSERSTAELFAAFYQNLKGEHSTAEALRQAKLQLLSKTGPDARKAPYYWAAFTLSGADAKVPLACGRWPWKILALIALVAGGWLGWRIRRK